MDENIIIPANNVEGGIEKITFKQSANRLFKFMKKIEYLKKIIENKAILPRYNEECIEYLNIKNMDKIAFPMVCFCDICLNKLESHCGNYGEYGIAFDKSWGMRNNIQPIHYISNNSLYANNLSDILHNTIKNFNTEDNSNILKPYEDYLFNYILFTKPITGKMKINSKYEVMNFHDEQEWRYIPNIDKEKSLPSLIPKNAISDNGLITYSDAIEECTNLWLKFEYKDIKYLIVKDNNDLKEIIKFIRQLDCNEDDKFSLTSKIFVIKELEDDF